MSLSFKGNAISASVEGKEVVSGLESEMSPYGMVAIGSGWHLAEFSQFSVVE
jgi:hypothetical protein